MTQEMEPCSASRAWLVMWSLRNNGWCKCTMEHTVRRSIYDFLDKYPVCNIPQASTLQ